MNANAEHSEQSAVLVPRPLGVFGTSWFQWDVSGTDGLVYVIRRNGRIEVRCEICPHVTTHLNLATAAAAAVEHDRSECV